mgnify:CR=1 FL=1
MQVGSSVINFAEIDSVIRKMGCQNLHALAFEMSDGIANGAVCFHLYPAVTTRRCRSHGAHAATRPDGVNFMYANGICGTNNRRNVMRFVDLLHADGQIRLPPGEHFADACITCWVHKTLISVSGDFNHVWHHADFAHDIRQMHTVTSGQTNKGAVDATIFLFRIQTLNIRSRGVNCRRQVCQRALMIEHLHLDFGDELLRRLFIPFHSHKLLWLFLVATDITAGFMVDHQTFTGADVGDNRVARNRAAAFRKGDQHAIGTFNGQMSVALGCRWNGGVPMLQIFRDHHAHCVTKSDFCQQIVKRCQLHAIQLALNIFLRDFIQLTATTQSMVEQTTAQAYRIITLEVFSN